MLSQPPQRAVAAYLALLAQADAAVGTMARRLSSIGHCHRASRQLDPGVHYVIAWTSPILGPA